MKPLLIGEAPSKNEVTEQPLMGRVGRRMAQLCDMTYEQYLEFFDRINLLHVRQDTREKGFEFDHAAATNAVHQLYLDGTIAPGRTIVMLGWRVTRAFFAEDYRRLNYFVRRDFGGVAYYPMPHPSGVNRWWNEPENYRKAAIFMHYIAQRHKVEAFAKAGNAPA